jgi:hypothetical protein
MTEEAFEIGYWYARLNKTKQGPLRAEYDALVVDAIGFRDRIPRSRVAQCFFTPVIQ